MTVTIDHADLFEWLPTMKGRGAVVAVLPDADEVGMDVDTWQDWFIEAAVACLDASTGPTVFGQTDRMVGGTWVDKAVLLDVAADIAPPRATAERRPLLWHKVALRRDVNAVDLHRPTYSHLLAYGPGRPGRRTPDVIHHGALLWRNGIGVEAARFVMGYLRDVGVTTVVNPGCGHGTLLAAAADRGMDGYGCDIDPHRVEVARGLAARHRDAVPWT